MLVSRKTPVHVVLVATAGIFVTGCLSPSGVSELSPEDFRGDSAPKAVRISLREGPEMNVSNPTLSGDSLVGSARPGFG